MGTCCGKVEKKTAEPRGSSEALADEAKPLRPLRDAEVRRRKANKSLESLDSAASNQTEEKPGHSNSKHDTKAVEIEGREVKDEIKAANLTEDAASESSKIEQVRRSIQNFDLKEIEEELRNGAITPIDATPSPSTEETNQDLPEADQRIPNTKQVDQSNTNESSLADSKHTEKNDSSTAHKQASEENASPSSKALEETDLEQTVVPVEKGEFETEGTKVETNTEACPGSGSELLKENSRYSSKTPEDIVVEQAVFPIELSLAEKEKLEAEEVKVGTNTEASHESGSKLLESKLLEESAGSSNKALEDSAVEPTVFPIELSPVEKENLEAEGVKVEATTETNPGEQILEENGREALENKLGEETVFAELSRIEKEKLEDEGVKLENEGRGASGAKLEHLDDKAQSDTKALHDSAASAESNNTYYSKIESDLEALLTPDLLKKLSEQTNGTVEIKHHSEANEKQINGSEANKKKIDGSEASEKNETDGSEAKTLVRSTTAPDFSTRNHPTARLSQQEQRQSRNSFLGNFLQEGVFSSFDEQFNSMTSKDTPTSKKIEEISSSTEKLRRQVENFSGGKTGTEYMFLESSLLINIDELNKIEPESPTEKAEALTRIYELLKKLDENSVF